MSRPTERVGMPTKRLALIRAASDDPEQNPCRSKGRFFDRAQPTYGPRLGAESCGATMPGIAPVPEEAGPEAEEVDGIRGAATIACGGPGTPYVVTGAAVLCVGRPPDVWQPAQAAAIIDKAVRYAAFFIMEPSSRYSRVSRTAQATLPHDGASANATSEIVADAP